MLLQRLGRIQPAPFRLAVLVSMLMIVAMQPRIVAAQDEEFDLSKINTMEIPVESPLIKSDVVAEIAEALAMDESQSELVRALHQGYVDQFTQAATEHRDRLKTLMDELQGSGALSPGERDMEEMARVGMDMQKEQREWLDRRQQFGTSFFENVKATLAPDQLAQWPAFERDRRRRTQLHVGAFFAGEGVDVVALIDDLDLAPPERSAIAQLIDSYAMEVDGLLQQRIRASEEVRNIDYTDPGAEVDIFGKFERVLSVRRKIRDANRRHSQIIGPSIPGAASEQLIRRFHQESYPMIYRPTQADSYIEQVLTLETLTDDQRRGVEGVAMMYRDQVAAANQALAQLLAEHEDSIEKTLKDSNPMMLAMVGGMSAYADEGVSQQQMPFDAKDLLMDEEQEKRQEDLNRQKRGYVVAAIDQVWAVLNPSQQEQAARPEVPEETPEQMALRQVRNMMRQTMQYTEDMVREAQEQGGDR